MKYIAVINTDEQPIEAIIRELGNNVIDNKDGESYWFNNVEYCYYPISIKQMPIEEVTIYEIIKCVS
jgi:hypothetical protein